VRIGSRWLTPEDFRVGADVAAARTEPLEIYFWSCRTGAEARGKDFMQRISEHSMSHVFASTGLIGDKDQGGTWELDTVTKPRAAVPFSQEARDAFGVVLAGPQPDLAANENTQATATALVNASEADGISDQAIFPGLQTPASSDQIDRIQITVAGEDLSNDSIKIGSNPFSLGSNIDSTTAEVGGVASVAFSYDSSTKVLTFSPSSGNFTDEEVFAVLTSLTFQSTSTTEGERTFELAYSEAGGTFGSSSTQTLTLDTTAPAAPTGIAEQGSSDLADGTLNAAEDDSTTFRVSLPGGCDGTEAASGDTVELLLGGASFGTPKTVLLT
jgi:hypothetical protein